MTYAFRRFLCVLSGQKPSDLIDTWFSESEDSPDARHSDGDETITSYSQLTMTDGDFAALQSPLDDEETDTTLLDGTKSKFQLDQRY